MAVEVRPEGVYAARANDDVGVMAQVSTAALPAGHRVVPSLNQGNVTDRIALIAALKRTLGAVQMGRSRDVTLILPDSAVRVLLLDFDELPSKADDVLPVIRFRLVKLLPFPPEAAQISYQVMSRHSLVLQVLVVAIPNEVLAEYESAVREAGFEPGAVLPSTLAVAAAIDDAGQTASLLVNGGEYAVTTAILRQRRTSAAPHARAQGRPHGGGRCSGRAGARKRGPRLRGRHRVGRRRLPRWCRWAC